MERSTAVPASDKSIEYMREAILEARKALEEGEIPVGAVIVHEGKIIGRGHNTTEQDGDPTAHAEINAIRQAEGLRTVISMSPWSLVPCAQEPWFGPGWRA